MHGANIALELTGTAVEARGDMLIKNVPLKASWQHVFGVPVGKQPPLTITASLDANDRTQLGLDINDFVQGEVATEITVLRDARNEQRVHLRADLANAEIGLDSIAWKKPKGRASIFQCDIVRQRRRLPHRIGERPARRRQCGGRRLDGRRSGSARPRVPLSQFLDQCHHQPADARQAAARRRSGRSPPRGRATTAGICSNHSSMSPASLSAITVAGRAWICGPKSIPWSATTTALCATSRSRCRSETTS